MNSTSQKGKKGGAKLFCSYCHKDSGSRDRFSEWIATLKRSKLVAEWYDGRIPAGGTVTDEIRENMKKSDIVVLFLSHDFLNSDSCMEEVELALELRKEKKVEVIPVVLRKCPWRDPSTGLADLLALPKDGKPISEWSKKDDAWMSVYEGIRRVVSEHVRKKRVLVKEFEREMTDPGIGGILMNGGRDALLEAIYVHPSLADGTLRYGRKSGVFADISSERLARISGESGQLVLVTGEDRSGKTSLCRMLFTSHLKDGRIPVYLNGDDITNDNLSNLVRNQIARQYQHSDMLPHEISFEDVVPIVDDFHKSPVLKFPSPENSPLHSLLRAFKNEGFPLSVLAVDGFDARFQNFEWEKIEEMYEIEHYSVKPLGYSGRAALIKKWILLTGEHGEDIEKELDRREEYVNAVVMENRVPDYPFFTLMTLQTMPAGNANPRDQGLTSYGYCYHAWFVHSLVKKGGVRSGDLGVYLNLLTEWAYHLYTQNPERADRQEFSAFFQPYKKKYTVPFDEETMRKVLVNSRLLVENLYNWEFPDYAFHYFVARKMAHDLHDREKAPMVEEEIRKICKYAYRRKCASIVLFLMHHAPQNSFLIEQLRENMRSLFSRHSGGHACPGRNNFFR